ncbi:MAG: cob(I)yrinic acid a,c-diamide adenosyltransferase [Gammaproteobacteria bacterium]|nr:cob(I)yrinic acid a,c-diamide adenosyltransferase [Gammaproteobacteria bacterium]
MGKRLSRIYTRTGDAGTTSTAAGERVDKDSLRIEAIGEVDELNSVLGMVLAESIPDAVNACLTRVQNDLFDLGGELAMPEYGAISDAYTTRLEQELDAFNGTLPALKEFILPAGGRATSACHLARSVCRRAERRLVSLNREEPLSADLLAYVNRLSDLLFVVARILARHENGAEVLWQPRKHREE